MMLREQPVTTERDDGDEEQLIEETDHFVFESTFDLRKSHANHPQS